MWLQCFGKYSGFPEKWWFLPWKFPPPFQIQTLPVAGLGEEQGETSRIEWRVWSGQHRTQDWCLRIIWDKQEEKEFRNMWLIRLELHNDHLAKKFTEPPKDWWMSTRNKGTEKVPPTFQAMLVLGFEESLVQESRISWNSASFSQKMMQCLVIFTHTTQISVLLVWLLNSETGFCSTQLNSNK